MNEVSTNSNERQSKNKNRALHFAGSKAFREQMEETVATTEGTKTGQRIKRARRPMEPSLKKFE